MSSVVLSTQRRHKLCKRKTMSGCAHTPRPDLPFLHGTSALNRALGAIYAEARSDPVSVPVFKLASLRHTGKNLRVRARHAHNLSENYNR